MLIREIPLAETGSFPRIVTDYLSGNDFLKPFYTYPPALASFEKAITDRHFDEAKRKILVDVLSDQYRQSGIMLDALTQAQISSLGNPGTYTVTTGHQLCLFTGPLYFIYKILTTIKLAEELKEKYPSKHVVPVFWLASEDHDFAEVNHVHLFGKTYTWELDSHNQPVGRLRTSSLAPLIDEVKTLFASQAQLPELLHLLEDAYLNSENLSVATRKIVHALFSRYGLLMIEPDDARLKHSLKNVMHDDILGHKSVDAIRQTNAVLEQQYKLQVNGRDINFFYLSENGRQLIKKQREIYTVANTDVSFTEEQIKAEIMTHPERFSPNVVLRPVYQELILPNLAYIGGPGEIAYWLQLKDVFEQHGVFFPVVWMRNSFLLSPHNLAKKIEKSGLDLPAYFLPAEQLSKKFLENAAGFDLGEVVTTVDQQLQLLIDELKKVDNQLSSKVVKYKGENAAFFNKFRKEVNEKIRERSETDLAKVLKIKETLFPNGIMQERFDNYLQYQPNKAGELISFLYTYLNLDECQVAVISV